MRPESEARAAEKAHATIAFVGDVMLGRLVDAEIGSRPPEWFWGDTLPVLRGADALVGNLECAITDHPVPWTRTRKVFHFRARPEAVRVLAAAGFTCVSLANNHILDYEEEGLLDTLRHLDAAGIRHAGAGRDIGEAMAPALFEAAGMRLGMFALTDNEPAFAAGAGRPGVHYRAVEEGERHVELLEDMAMATRAAGADLVILSAHMGPNMVARPSAPLARFARDAAAAGVDVYHGHSAHVFQGVARVAGRLVLHDTGDFLDDYAVDPGLRNDWSFIFLVEADGAGPRLLRLVPVRLRFARVELAKGRERAAICERMAALCRELGTPVSETDEGLEIAARA